MSRIGRLLKALATGGVRCPWCECPSPHRFPHAMGCPWYDPTDLARYDRWVAVHGDPLHDRRSEP
jgi:hypothetical protein